MRSSPKPNLKKIIIARVINDRPDRIVFTQKQMDLAIKSRNNSMSKEELINELRGGAIEDWVAAFGVIIANVKSERDSFK